MLRDQFHCSPLLITLASNYVLRMHAAMPALEIDKLMQQLRSTQHNAQRIKSAVSVDVHVSLPVTAEVLLSVQQASVSTEVSLAVMAWQEPWQSWSGDPIVDTCLQLVLSLIRHDFFERDAAAARDARQLMAVLSVAPEFGLPLLLFKIVENKVLAFINSMIILSKRSLIYIRFCRVTKPQRVCFQTLPVSRSHWSRLCASWLPAASPAALQTTRVW
jgi:hypothetical protein